MALPNFLVIGAYKSGTTSLHHHLRRHPQVFVPEHKEPSFLALDGDPVPEPRLTANAVTTLEAYERLFRGVAGERAIGEVSPEYLVNPRACGRILARVPHARLVAVLRNPIERAYSDYLMYVRDGQERCDFGEALRQQDERRRRGDPTGWYVETGRYGEQLARYYDAFPADQIRVHLFEDLVDEPDRVMADIFGFIGVDAVAVGEIDQRNVSGVPANRVLAALLRSRRLVAPAANALLPDAAKARIERLVQRGLRRPPLPDDARDCLRERFAPDVDRLAGLIGRDLSHWTA